MQLHTHLHLHAYAYGHNLTGKLDLFEFFSNFPFDFQLIKSVLERSSGEGNGNLPQYSCLENSMDGGAW